MNLETMITNTLKTIGLAALLAQSLPVTAAPFIVQPVGVNASSVFGETTGPENTINGGGLAELSGSLPTGAPVPAQWPGHIAFNNWVNWHAAAAPAAPVTLTFDLGASYHLTGMHLWNMNQNGLGGRSIKTATISVSSDGTYFTDVSVGGRDSNGFFIPAPGIDGYRGEDYTFVGTGRFVRFSITINGYDTLDYVGISEVRFIAAAPADSLPEITSPPTATGQVRVAFSYPITATSNPTSFGAANLPVGLQVDSASGLISGVPLASGSFNVTLLATNIFGSASTNLLLQIAPPVPLAASTVLQPSGGANDGTDDGSATKGKDRSQWADASGSSAVLYLLNSPCNVGLQPAYLQFAVSSQPTQFVAKAEIAVYCKMFFNGAGWAWPVGNYQVSLRRVTTTWNELTLPAGVAPTPLASRTVTAVGGGTPGFVEFEGWLTFDITALYRDWASAAAANDGVQLAIDTPYCANGNEFWVYSSDIASASLRPKLTVETGLQPTLTITANAGNAVLGWNTLSNAIYQVQSAEELNGWTNWGDPFLGRGGPTNFVVPVTDPTRFFRVGVR